MNIIYECAFNFPLLFDVKYHFTFSQRRKCRSICINFKNEDFRHIAGLQYIDDIVIERNPSKLIPAILRGDINDEILNKSSKYTASFSNKGSIFERVQELRYLEHYLDNSDFMRIYEMQNSGSILDAEYFIESMHKHSRTTVYIFIRKREEDNNYVIVPFFKKHFFYQGTLVYWMLKLKETNNNIKELYRHPNYI